MKFAARLKLPGAWTTADLPAAAVFACRGAVRFHTGILFRDETSHSQLHLEFHHLLRVETVDLSHAWLVPGIDPIHLKAVAARCRVIKKRQPEVPYGLDGAYSRFDPSGNLKLGKGEIGLTCATFVLAVFGSVGLHLLKTDTWHIRGEDLTAGRRLVELLQEVGHDAHAQRVETRIGVWRYRPEEVMAATYTDALPVRFEIGATAGAWLAEELPW